MTINYDRCLFLVEDAVAGATVSASSSAAGFVPANVGLPALADRWRPVALPADITVDFGADRVIEAVLLGFCREWPLATGGTLRFRLDADGGAPGTGAAHDATVAAGLAPGYGLHLHLPDAAVTARYLTVTLALTGADFVDLGRLMAGPVWQPAANYDFGAVEGWVDPSDDSARAVSGTVHVDQRDGWRSWSLSLSLMPEADRAWLRELHRSRARRTSFAWCADPRAPATEAAVVRFSRDPSRTRNVPIHWDTQLSLEEVI